MRPEEGNFGPYQNNVGQYQTLRERVDRLFRLNGLYDVQRKRNVQLQSPELMRLLNLRKHATGQEIPPASAPLPEPGGVNPFVSFNKTLLTGVPGIVAETLGGGGSPKDIPQNVVSQYTTPAVPVEENPVRKIPVVGPSAANVTSGVTSPLGALLVGTSGVAPTAYSGLGSVVGGSIGRATGLPFAQTIGETAGGFYGGQGGLARQFGNNTAAEKVANVIAKKPAPEMEQVGNLILPKGSREIPDPSNLGTLAETKAGNISISVSEIKPEYRTPGGTGPGQINIDINQGSGKVTDMADVLHNVYHIVANNPGHDVVAHVVNDRLDRIMKGLGLTGQESLGVGGRWLGTNYDLTTADLDKIYQRLAPGGNVASLVGGGGASAQSTAQKLGGTLESVGRAHWQPGQQTSRELRQAVTGLGLSQGEKSALINHLADDPEAQAAVTKFMSNGRIENEEALKRGIASATQPGAFNPNEELQKAFEAAGFGRAAPSGPPTREEWIKAWRDAGYEFPPKDVPEGIFPGHQPNLFPEQPHQPILRPGEPGAITPNKQPELIPGMGTGAAETPPIADVRPQFPTQGRQGYFPGMGSSLEHQPTLPGMETPPYSGEPSSIPGLGQGGEAGAVQAGLTPEPVPIPNSPATQLEHTPLTDMQMQALRIQQRLGGALHGVSEANRNYAQKLLNKVSEGKVLTRVERNFFKKTLGEDIDSMIPQGAGLGAELVGLLNLPRALLASGDLSATLRQTYVLSAGHPELLPKIYRTGIESFASEQAAERIATEHAARYNALPQALKDKMDLTTWHAQGPDVGKTSMSTSALRQEEAYYLGTATKAENLVHGAPILRNSNRAYVNQINEARLSVAEQVINGWKAGKQDIGRGPIASAMQGLFGSADPRKWANDPKALEALGTFLQHASGRGGLGPLNKFAPVLNIGFFAPRLLASRFQVFGDLRHPAIRSLVAKDITQSYGTGAAILGMLTASGVARTELDPRSADFGKAVVGNQHIDMFGGAGPMIRLTALMSTGLDPSHLGTIKVRTQAGEIIDANPEDIVAQFLRTKAAPLPGTAVDLLSGRNIAGQAVDTSVQGLGEKALSNVAPLVLQDIYQSVKHGGITAGAGITPLAVSGVGVQSYEPSARTQFLDAFKKAHPEIDTQDRGLVNLVASRDPNLQPLLEEQRKQGLERGSQAGVTQAENQAFFTQEEKDSHLTDYAAAVLQPHPAPDAGTKFVKAYQDYISGRAAVLKRQFFGNEPNQPVSPAGQILDSIRTLQVPFDNLTNTPDFESFEKQRSSLIEQLRKLSPEAATALEEPIRTVDPTVQAAERAYIPAQKLFHQALSMNKFKANIPNQDKIDELQKQASYVNQQLALSGHPNATKAHVWRIIREANPDVDATTLRWAQRLTRSAVSRKYSDPKREQFLVDNFLTLSKFYPNLYRSERLLKRIGKKYGPQVANLPS